MGTSFLNWWFVSSGQKNHLASKSLDFTVTATALALHTIVNYFPSCQEPLGAWFFTASCSHLHQCKPSAKHYHMAAFHHLLPPDREVRMRLKSFRETLRGHTHLLCLQSSISIWCWAGGRGLCSGWTQARGDLDVTPFLLRSPVMTS